MNDNEKPPRKFRAVYLWLLLPYLGMLWVPFYNRTAPALLGIPFFYWYQIAWIIGGSACIVPVYLAQERRRK